MSDEPDYLWDRSGRPDPDVLRLEQALGGLAYRGPAPALPPQATIPWSTLGMAAASLLVAGAAVVFSLVSEPAPPVARATPTPTPSTTPAPSPSTTTAPTPAAWEVTVLSGAPVCGPQRLTSRGALGVGEWLETDAGSSARLEVPKIGHVEVSPSTRVRLVTSAPRQRRLKLLVGRLTAQVDAPPRLFQVDTPSAQAIDLGCAYVLEVDPDGAASLSVTSGRVILVRRNVGESIVPRGASCRTDLKRGPGLPCFDDAPPELKAALAELDALEPSGGWGAKNPRYADALGRALQAARPRDTLPLWHLLQRVPSADRRWVYERLAGFVPPPAGATRAGLLALDRAMLDAWQRDLGWED